MLKIQDAPAYTDFNSLAKLKNEAKNNTAEAIKEVAKQFESVFVGMMLKSMRQASLAEGILDSSQSDFYRDMYDQQLSVNLSAEGGMGLADLIESQLSPDQSAAVLKDQGIGDYARKSLMRNSAPIIDKSILDGEAASSNSKINKISDSTFDSAENFISQLRPYAEQAAKKLGVDAKVLLSQAALETGWGKSVINTSDGKSSYNLFNIKADKSWSGQQTQIATLEFKDGIGKKEVAGFRAYASYQESFDDYVNFIKNNPRYKKALDVAEMPEQYMKELQQAGYATDPEYASKVMKIVQGKQITNAMPGLLALKQDQFIRR
ncbi:MAG: flagellar assembly peptidoglycan hydrolase FlgJ [Methylococcaceae bacterium]|nr:flagellar assembly peptidoglycan hydrolase FlgJ [Methylococcaceae bacterium]